MTDGKIKVQFILLLISITQLKSIELKQNETLLALPIIPSTRAMSSLSRYWLIHNGTNLKPHFYWSFISKIIEALLAFGN